MNTFIKNIINFGKCRIMNEINDHIKNAVENGIKTHGKDIDEIFGQYIPELKNEVENSIEALYSDLTIGLDPDEFKKFIVSFFDGFGCEKNNRYFEIINHLTVLDKVPFLIHGMYLVGNRWYAINHELLYQLLELLSFIVVKRRPPVARLIPMNSYRYRMNSSILKTFQFSFPWYEMFSDLPDNSLYLYANKSLDNKKKLTENQRFRLFLEISDDQELSEFLNQRK